MSFEDLCRRAVAIKSLTGAMWKIEPGVTAAGAEGWLSTFPVRPP